MCTTVSVSSIEIESLQQPDKCTIIMSILESTINYVCNMRHLESVTGDNVYGIFVFVYEWMSVYVQTDLDLSTTTDFPGNEKT